MPKKVEATSDSLLERWCLTVEREPRANSPGLAVFTHLWQHYREKHRHYHTPLHLAECFTVLDACGIEHGAELEYALWGHDVVYDTWFGNANEAASAAWADRALIALGFEDLFRARVRRLIFATKDHAMQGIPATQDIALIRDVDLCILGADAAGFDEYEKEIRAEYSHLSDSDFREGRLAFLHKLKRPKLFHLPWFIERFEDKAQANIQRSFEKLDALQVDGIMKGEGW